LEDIDLERRFGGLARLYGDEGVARLRQAHVCIVGVGGVGSWAAEALGRSGVGALTLIDMDHVAESNTNRQIHALDGAYGRAKVEAMGERLHAINPACSLHLVDDFATPDNLAELIAPGRIQAVVDGTDGVRAKAALIDYAVRSAMHVVTCGAAGGKTDPSALRIDDLSRTEQDPLLAKVRKRLRNTYGFPRGERRFGVSAVYSPQPMRWPAAACAPGGAADPTNGEDILAPEESNRSGGRRAAPQGLNCAGFGSVVTLTASMGLFAAARIISLLTGES
jgi:tRNA A37 threonylcarbamoyladenosine dehydratase